jgi:hypothetical protein
MRSIQLLLGLQDRLERAAMDIFGGEQFKEISGRA